MYPYMTDINCTEISREIFGKKHTQVSEVK